GHHDRAVRTERVQLHPARQRHRIPRHARLLPPRSRGNPSHGKRSARFGASSSSVRHGRSRSPIGRSRGVATAPNDRITYTSEIISGHVANLGSGRFYPISPLSPEAFPP